MNANELIRSAVWRSVLALMVMAIGRLGAADVAHLGDNPGDLFKNRIMPILNAKNPSSCTECHLSGVDLRSYIFADQEKTFASLRDRELIDVKNPDDSKILKFIARKPKKANPLTERVRIKELAAFRAWIRAAVKDPALLKAKPDTQIIGTTLPPEVIRHARKDRVLQSFVDNIWSQVGRCVNCHSPDRNQKQVREHGEQMSWIAPRDPAGTLDQLVEGGNIDTDAPEESLVLLKPAGLEDHGGGPKFLVGSPTYRQFLRFLTDYSATVNGRYETATDLPKPADEILVLTEQHLRVVDLPLGLDKTPMQVNLYRWDPRGKGWSKDRWGTVFGPIAVKKNIWQGLVSVTGPSGAPRMEAARESRLLPDGTYLAKIYIDRERKTTTDPNYKLGEQEFVGQVEIHGDWPAGYQPPKIIHTPRFAAR